MATKFKKGDIVKLINDPDHELYPAIIIDTQGTVPGESYRMINRNLTKTFRTKI